MGTRQEHRGAGGRVRPSAPHQRGDDQHRQHVLDADDFVDQGEFLEDGSGDRRGLPGTDDVRSDRNDDERSECR